MTNFDNLTPPTSAFIDSNNNVQDIQSVLESGAVVVTAAAPGPVVPVGSATVLQYDNIAPWVGKFINQDNEVIDLLDLLTSGAIKAQVSGGGGGGAPTTATYITQTDETAVLPNSSPLSALFTGFIAVETGSGDFVSRILAGTANQTIVTNGDGLNGNPTVSLSPTLQLPGTLALGGDLDVGSFDITKSSGSMNLIAPSSIDLVTPFVSVTALRRYTESTNKILFGVGLQQFLPDNILQMQISASGTKLAFGATVNDISIDSTFASRNDTSLATTQAIYDFVISQSSALTFNTVTVASQALAQNNIYYVNYSGTCVLTLPVLATAGAIIRIISNSTGDLFQIAQNAGQIIYFGSQAGISQQTTVGPSGYLLSVDPNTVVELQCIVDNAEWTVLNCQQNLSGV
jgi:hypothetical protein